MFFNDKSMFSTHAFRFLHMWWYQGRACFRLLWGFGSSQRKVREQRVWEARHVATISRSPLDRFTEVAWQIIASFLDVHVWFSISERFEAIRRIQVSVFAGAALGFNPVVVFDGRFSCTRPVFLSLGFLRAQAWRCFCRCSYVFAEICAFLVDMCFCTACFFMFSTHGLGQVVSRGEMFPMHICFKG